MDKRSNNKSKQTTTRSGKLFLIPSNLSSTDAGYFIPPFNAEIMQSLKVFFVEDIRSARRFISSQHLGIEIDSLQFLVLNKDTGYEDLSQMINILKSGKNAGVLSEAGCPGVADPGSDLTALAHRNNIRVIPLVGPSSLLLSLMASGFNGQNFVFHGYLPIREKERERKIRELENSLYKNHETQIFIETPYRNNQLFKSLMKTLKPQTLLCIAAGITGPEESIITRPVRSWKTKEIVLNKTPSVFLLYHE